MLASCAASSAACGRTTRSSRRPSRGCAPWSSSEKGIVMNDQLREEVRQHYAAAATRNGGCCGSDSTTGVMSLGSGDPLAAAGLRPGERVLDLGSGAGPDVIRAAGQIGPEGVVWGLDMTDEMLSLARENAAGVRNAHFLKGDIEAVPLPAASVDV